MSIFQNQKLGKMVSSLPLVILALVALVYMLLITDALCSETLVG